jgi:hypothetical protein
VRRPEAEERTSELAYAVLVPTVENGFGLVGVGSMNEMTAGERKSA